MAQISLEIPDELLEQLTQDGKSPVEVLQERLVLAQVLPLLSQRFESLAAQWRRETRHLSLWISMLIRRPQSPYCCD
jgi:hypothetical protein